MLMPTTTKVRYGGLAIKLPELGANGHRFEPSKRSKQFQRLMSRRTTSLKFVGSLFPYCSSVSGGGGFSQPHQLRGYAE